MLDGDEPRFSILAANEAFLSATGHARADLLGRGAVEALSAAALIGADAGRLHESLVRARRHGVPELLLVESASPGAASAPEQPPGCWRFEIGPSQRPPSACLLLLTIHAAPAPSSPDPGGGLERELARRNQDLESARRELDAFSYSVSHDLRAPLRAIEGFSQALAHDYHAVLDDQARHYIERVRAGAQRMSSLIDDLLALSRVQRAPLLLREVDLSAAARRVADALTRGSPGRAVAVAVAPGLRALADTQLVEVLLSQLLGNAWKFTRQRQPAHVDVGSEPGPGGPAFFVKDDGVGFDPAHSARLFTPFQRLHRAGEFEGNGIGLAIAERIVSRHGGRIWARSEPGEGTTVCFSLGGKHD